MIIANINSQTWPQTKFVISLTIFQVIVIILFGIFVRYDPSLDAKHTGGNNSDTHGMPAFDPYPCKSMWYSMVQFNRKIRLVVFYFYLI